jgi:hypothetical protein
MAWTGSVFLTDVPADADDEYPLVMIIGVDE